MSSGQEQAGSAGGGARHAASAGGGLAGAGPHEADAETFGREYPVERGSGTAAGFTIVAATLMVISGLWSVTMGLTAVIKDQFFVTLPNYAFRADVTTWGWIHLGVGALVFAAGVCLILGQLWARVLGVILALISAVENFLFIPYYPVWSLIVIAVDVFIIWALVTGDRRQFA